MVLAEVEEPALAVELWLQLRHLRDWLGWSGGDPVEAGLFHPQPCDRVLERRAGALEAAGTLGPALRTFHMLTDGVAVERAALSSACVGVADWAHRAGYGATAMQFSAAAASAQAENPACLNVAGLMHRLGSEWTSAELYYLRAAYFARTQNDADERVSAHIGLAALWFSRGQHRRARRHLDRATNAARRNGSAWLAAHAQHDLMLMLTERGEYAQAESAASRAVSLYPLSDPRLPFFAADFAFLLIAQGMYRHAIPMLERFLTLVEPPARQVIGLSLLVRAYAAASHPEFSAARERLEALLRVYTQDSAAALYHLAEAARSRGDWTQAAEYAAQCLRTALERGDRAVARYAAALSGAISVKQSAALPPDTGAGAGRRAAVNNLLHRLSRWSPMSRRGRKRQPRRNHWVGV